MRWKKQHAVVPCDEQYSLSGETHVDGVKQIFPSRWKLFELKSYISLWAQNMNWQEEEDDPLFKIQSASNRIVTNASSFIIATKNFQLMKAQLSLKEN